MIDGRILRSLLRSSWQIITCRVKRAQRTERLQTRGEADDSDQCVHNLNDDRLSVEYLHDVFAAIELYSSRGITSSNRGGEQGRPICKFDCKMKM